MRTGSHSTLPVMSADTADTRPASILGPGTRLVSTVGFILALVGAALSIAVPVFDLRSDACGSISCGLLQVIGKAVASGGLGFGLGALCVASPRARRLSAPAVGRPVAGPPLLLAVPVLHHLRRPPTGTA